MLAKFVVRQAEAGDGATSGLYIFFFAFCEEEQVGPMGAEDALNQINWDIIGWKDETVYHLQRVRKRLPRVKELFLTQGAHPGQCPFPFEPPGRSPGLGRAEVKRAAGPGIVMGLPRKPRHGRVLNHITDGCLEISVIRNVLMMNLQIPENLAQIVLAGTGHRSLADILMHELVGFIELSIQDKMDMVIHQAEGQDEDVILPCQQVDAVHRCDEVIFVAELHILHRAVCREMPTVLYREVLPLDKGQANGQIG